MKKLLLTLGAVASVAAPVAAVVACSNDTNETDKMHTDSLSAVKVFLASANDSSRFWLKAKDESPKFSPSDPHSKGEIIDQKTVNALTFADLDGVDITTSPPTPHMMPKEYTNINDLNIAYLRVANIIDSTKGFDNPKTSNADTEATPAVAAKIDEAKTLVQSTKGKSISIEKVITEILSQKNYLYANDGKHSGGNKIALGGDYSPLTVASKTLNDEAPTDAAFVSLQLATAADILDILGIKHNFGSLLNEMTISQFNEFKTIFSL